MTERKLIAEIPIKINAYDIDAMGIVSNIVYIRWFEDLRMAFLNEYYPLDQMLRGNISPILMKTEATYKAPLTIFDKPTGRCWLLQSGETRWEMELEIASDETIHCVGSQKGRFYDLEKKKVAKMPLPLRQLFSIK